MGWRKETEEMETHEFGYSRDGKRFYGRYPTRALAEAEARDRHVVPTHTAIRRIDGPAPEEIIHLPGSIQEVLATSDDVANVQYRAHESLMAEAHTARREARAGLMAETLRVRKLGRADLEEERELADMAYAEKVEEREVERQAQREAKREEQRLEKLAEELEEVEVEVEFEETILPANDNA